MLFSRKFPSIIRAEEGVLKTTDEMLTEENKNMYVVLFTDLMPIASIPKINIFSLSGRLKSKSSRTMSEIQTGGNTTLHLNIQGNNEAAHLQKVDGYLRPV